VNPHVYVHEVMYTVPGREEAYMTSVMSIRDDPGRTDRKTHDAFGQFRSVDTSGPWPGVVNIWEEDWDSLASDLAAQFHAAHRDVALEQWWNRNVHLRTGGYDRVLVPAPFSPTTRDLRDRGFTGEIFLHEILTLPFDEADRYLGRIEEAVLPALGRCEVELVGAFRVAMRPRQVLTILGAREWSDLMTFLAAAEDDPALRAFAEYRAAVVDHVDEVLLIPARHDPLATGRTPA
jgi:hypothetical protein